MSTGMMAVNLALGSAKLSRFLLFFASIVILLALLYFGVVGREARFIGFPASDEPQATPITQIRVRLVSGVLFFVAAAFAWLGIRTMYESVPQRVSTVTFAELPTAITPGDEESRTLSLREEQNPARPLLGVSRVHDELRVAIVFWGEEKTSAENVDYILRPFVKDTSTDPDENMTWRVYTLAYTPEMNVGALLQEIVEKTVPDCRTREFIVQASPLFSD